MPSSSVRTAKAKNSSKSIPLGVPGTGTASDAVVLAWPREGVAPEPFAGPRAPLGAALALATHDAVFRSAGENQR